MCTIYFYTAVEKGEFAFTYYKLLLKSKTFTIRKLENRNTTSFLSQNLRAKVQFWKKPDDLAIMEAVLLVEFIDYSGYLSRHTVPFQNVII